jgi:hypothetical protein
MEFFSRNLRRGAAEWGAKEARGMKNPTMTLHEVQQTLQEQDVQLQAAYRALTEETANTAVALPIQAIERLREVCSFRSVLHGAHKPANGIRC